MLVVIFRLEAPVEVVWVDGVAVPGRNLWAEILGVGSSVPAENLRSYRWQGEGAQYRPPRRALGFHPRGG